MKQNSSAIERVDLSNISITVFEHVHRYIFAANFVKDKIVLDAACGTGYGSNYLSNYANLVYGIDINQDVIENNKEIYKKENLFFINGSIYQLPFDDNIFDVIVSFETVEHVNDGNKVLSEFKRVLKPEGILIISTPNKQISIEKSIINPFHKHEYFEDEFKELINKFFSNVIINYQSNCFSNVIYNKNSNKKNEVFSTNINDIQKGSIKKNNFIIPKEYFIAIAYNDFTTIDNNKNSVYMGNEFNEFMINEIKKMIEFQNKIYNSLNYKIGYYITYPIKFLLNLFKIKKYPDL